MSEIPRHLRVALASATRAFRSGDLSSLGTANEDLQPLLDAAIAWGRGQHAEVARLTTQEPTCLRCEDFAADAHKVLNEKCAPDEKHCSCVPHLRAEAARLTARLAEVEAEREEMRLTRLAERGDAEGLPPQWKVTTRDQYGRPTAFHRADRPGSLVSWWRGEGGDWSWHWQQERDDGQVEREGWFALARPALLSWDAALASTPAPAPE